MVRLIQRRAFLVRARGNEVGNRYRGWLLRLGAGSSAVCYQRRYPRPQRKLRKRSILHIDVSECPIHTGRLQGAARRPIIRGPARDTHAAICSWRTYRHRPSVARESGECQCNQASNRYCDAENVFHKTLFLSVEVGFDGSSHPTPRVFSARPRERSWESLPRMTPAAWCRFFRSLLPTETPETPAETAQAFYPAH